jgi:hypothetical protein
MRVSEGKNLSVTVDDENYFVEETHPLEMVWLRDMTDDTIVEGVRFAFVVFTPEAEYMCIANSSKEKEEWMWHLAIEIVEVVLGKGHVNQEANKEVKELIQAANVREGEYIFSTREDFKGGHYSGGFADGAPKGNGVLTWPNGDVYEGEFSNGCFHGVGTRSWTSHQTYLTFNGEWENGEIEGYGEMKFCDRSVYRGWWHQGKQHGYGEMIEMNQKTLKNHSYYGSWVNGCRDGYGIEDNEELVTRFIGKWQRNSRNGPGILITSSGTVAEGLFQNSEMITDSEENSTIDVQEKWQPLFTSCVSGLDQILDRKLDKTTPSPCNQERHASESPELKVKLTLPKHRTAKSFSVHNGDNGHEQPPPPPTLRPVLPFLDVQAEIKSHQSIEDILQTTSHPFGMLLNKWSLCFIASYSGNLGQHKELLPHAINDINIVVRTLHAVISTYYPKLPELEDSNVETKINRISDYFGSQDHVWLYRTIFPPIFDTLMDLYRESVREKEETFAGFRQRMMEEYNDGRGLAVHFGFGDHFEELSSSGALRRAEETLHMITSCKTSTSKLIAINDSYKLLEKACSRLPVEEDCTNEVIDSVVYYLLVLTKVSDWATQLQFIQDFAGMALTFGDMGFAFKKLKDCYHLLLNNPQQFCS